MSKRRDVLAAIIMLRNYSNINKDDWGYRGREIFRIGIELLEIAIGVQAQEMATRMKRR